MQSIEQRYYRETEEHNYMGCKLLVKKDDMLDSLDGKERSYDNSFITLISHQPTRAQSKKAVLKAWNNIAIDFHQEMGQEYSTMV